MKYIFWDFDDTLAWREGGWSQTIYELLAEKNIENPDIQKIKQQLQKGFPWHHYEAHQSQLFKELTFWQYFGQLFTPVFQSFGLRRDEAKLLSCKVKNQYLRLDKWHVYDDVFESLQKLTDDGYNQIIISNHVPELEQLVSGLKLSPYFIRVISSGVAGYCKPNMNIFKIALSELKDFEKGIMIGDSYSADVRGASGVGLKCILVRKDNVFGHELYQPDLLNIDHYLKQIF